MKPFYLTDSAKRLTGSYPPHEAVADALKLLTRQEKLGFMRLWLSEGIPFAFRDVPLVYESIRDLVASRLDVPAWSVTIIGSGRIGFSMSPAPAFGRPFRGDSDLDLSVAEGQLFSKLEKDYESWKSDVGAGRVTPKTAAEKRFWPENLRVLPLNLARGFIDPYKIPPYFKYATAQAANQTQWLIQSRLKVTPGAPPVKNVSIRVYRNWNAFIDRLEFNLYQALRSFVKT